MFGCFTRNIYVSRICLHFVCAFELSHDSFEGGKDPEKAASGWSLLFFFLREDKLP